MSNQSLSSLPKVSDLKVVSDDEKIVKITKEHERLAWFNGFSYENAFELGSIIRSLFLERYAGQEWGIVIKIELFSGHILFAATVGNAPFVGPDNWVWATGKSNVVRRMGKSSLRFARELVRSGKTPAERGLSLPDYALAGGGFPINIRGVDSGPIGAILVSGLPQLEDHQLIVDSIAKASHLLA